MTTLAEFDRALGTLMRQAIHNQIPPVSIIGVLECHKSDALRYITTLAMEAKKPSSKVANSKPVIQEDAKN